MGTRRMARERALQALYEADITGGTDAPSVAWDPDPSMPLPEDARAFAERLTASVMADLPAIDALIERCSRNWRVARMGAVERAILRLATGEMRADPGTPAAVVIDEAVELARTYGDRDAQAFVNGILEGVRRALTSPEPPGPSDALDEAEPS